MINQYITPPHFPLLKTMKMNEITQHATDLVDTRLPWVCVSRIERDCHVIVKIGLVVRGVLCLCLLEEFIHHSEGIDFLNVI